MINTRTHTRAGTYALISPAVAWQPLVLCVCVRAREGVQPWPERDEGVRKESEVRLRGSLKFCSIGMIIICHFTVNT